MKPLSDPLKSIAELSHEFGTDLYVKGGGGNTSVKNAETLWVKPSGTTLETITPEAFLPMDRAKLQAIHAACPPDDPTAREAMVKDLMLAAVREGATGRPSVEAPLHDSFNTTFVVHTHPAMVNGMTCSRDGKNACARLFPDALWVDYVDPGFVLSRTVREKIQDYRTRHGREPEAVFLENHGVFVAGDTSQDIRRVYHAILSTLRVEYETAGVATSLPAGIAPADDVVEKMKSRLQELLGEKAAFVFAAEPAKLTEGPLSPDHIVYAKSYFLSGEPTPQSVAAFQDRHGYPPLVVGGDTGVFGLGASEKIAKLALTFALDGALVRQLADAFGGVQYMSQRARKFIEDWEVESYRMKQI
ncbi:MAG: class II aldolase [Phycisphaerae bacterium]|nr:class II aldolase [Phycisphaerae bacterium]